MRQTPSSTDRRAFLKQAGAAALAGPTVAGLLETAPARAATQARRGGTAVVALAVFDPKSSLDPALATSDFDLLAGGMLYDNLVKLDTSFAPHPALAESWSVSSNALRWTFKLRRGVTFSDGSPLTARDVAYTLKRVLAPATKSPAQSSLAANLRASGIKVVDARTLRLELKSPNAFFGAVLGGYNLRIVKDGAKNLTKRPIGTGPFMLVKYTPGETFVVKRNPHYWRSGLPYLDGVRVESIPEQATKVQSILSGGADLADAVDIPTAQRLRGNHAAQLYVLKNASFNVIAVQAGTAPFNDLRVRQALKYALDHKRMAQVVLQGEGVAGADIPIAPDDPLFPRGFKPLPYDPDKAKALLAQAGYSSGLPVTLYSADAAAFMQETAVAFQAIVKSGGVNVQIQQTPAASYFSDIWMKKPAFSSFWLRQHPDTILAQACLSNGPWNEAQFKNAHFDKLVLAARRTSSAAKQRQLYAEAMPLLAHTSGWIVPQWGDRIWPAKKRMRGVRLDFIDNADLSGAYLQD